MEARQGIASGMFTFSPYDSEDENILRVFCNGRSTGFKVILCTMSGQYCPNPEIVDWFKGRGVSCEGSLTLADWALKLYLEVIENGNEGIWDD